MVSHLRVVQLSQEAALMTDQDEPKPALISSEGNAAITSLCDIAESVIGSDLENEQA